MRKRAVRRKIVARRPQDEKPGTVSALKPHAGSGTHHASSQIFHVLGEKKEAGSEPVLPWKPEVSGAGHPHRETVQGQSLRLQGRTDVRFDGGFFETRNVRVRPAINCGSCADDQCVHVTGEIAARYRATTTVTLPSVSDYPDLTECQQARVQSAIDSILAPHEQQHVAAYRTYNGTTRTPFDLELCRTDFDPAIRSMFQAEASARESAARAASDALDPFHFDVDVTCEDEHSKRRPGGEGES